jgi:vacuolar-type H+-ATPase subunit E/Vma4
MQKSANPLLGELKRETEQTRAGFTQTVEQLRTSVSDTASDIRQRLSPESIKAEVSDYVRSRGERLVEDVTAAARRNPMQAVAVGAGIAYPLLRLARAIPMPVLLIGAGLFFTGSKTGQGAVQKASDMASDLNDEARRRSHDLSDQVGASVASARDAATDAVDRIGEMMSTGADRLRSSADSAGAALNAQTDVVRGSTASLADAASAKGRDLKGNVLDLADAAGERAEGLVSDGSSAVQSALASTRDNAVETARDLRDRAAAASDRAGKTIFQTIEQNPLLVAGVGLLIGGLIASALPRSEIEDNLVGEASEAAKNRARDAASRGFDATKGAAGEILENAARQAGAEGLTSDGLDTAAKDIGQRVRRVAEAAVTTAFEPENRPTSPADGGEYHG